MTAFGHIYDRETHKNDSELEFGFSIKLSPKKQPKLPQNLLFIL